MFAYKTLYAHSLHLHTNILCDQHKFFKIYIFVIILQLCHIFLFLKFNKYFSFYK